MPDGKLSRHQLRVAKVLALVPELERHEDEQSGLETGGNSPLDEGSCKVSSRLRGQPGDLLHVAQREDQSSGFVERRDEFGRLRPERLEITILSHLAHYRDGIRHIYYHYSCCTSLNRSAIRGLRTWCCEPLREQIRQQPEVVGPQCKLLFIGYIKSNTCTYILFFATFRCHDRARDYTLPG